MGICMELPATVEQVTLVATDAAPFFRLRRAGNLRHCITLTYLMASPQEVLSSKRPTVSSTEQQRPAAILAAFLPPGAEQFSAWTLDLLHSLVSCADMLALGNPLAY